MRHLRRSLLFLMALAVARPLPAQQPGAFAGGVPSGVAGDAPLAVTLADAVARGMEANLGRILADQGAAAAAAESELARSAVLPHVGASASASRAKISLDQFGFPVAPGESPLIGPFDVADFRLSLDSALLDLSGLARARAAAAERDAARARQADARELVVAVCSALYLQVVTAESRVAAAEAQVATARALADRARTLKGAGVVAGIDVLRADYQLAAQRQRRIDAADRLAGARLALARAIGLPLAQPFELTDRAPFAGMAAMPAGEAIAAALAGRAEVRAQQAAVRAAAARVAAARNLRLPSLWLHGDWGQVGPDTAGLNATYAAAAMVRVPLWEGGAIAAGQRLAESALAQQRAILADLEARVELEVRSALLDVSAAQERVRVAEEQAALAGAQLEQAQDRFAAGVTNNLEVVQAQESATDASDAVIGGRASLAIARVRLARAVGEAAGLVPGGEGGAR